MYLFSTPFLIRKILSKNIKWELPNNNNAIYITFDDGPNPDTTPFILDILKRYSAKATFFCLGKNVKAHPTIHDAILQNGHTVGNHTFNHYNGWRTNIDDYLEDVESCNQLIKSSLFRPPYGKLKSAQLKKLKDRYSVIMWSKLSGDFDIKLNKEKCLKSLLINTKSGDIVVFHDSIKAKDNVQYILPRYLECLCKNNFTTLAIPNLSPTPKTVKRQRQ